MESMSSSSCWCCAECTQSRLERHSAAAAAAAASDAAADAVCNGLMQTDELCEAQQQLTVTDASCHHRPSDVSSCEDIFDDYMVCYSINYLTCKDNEAL